MAVNQAGKQCCKITLPLTVLRRASTDSEGKDDVGVHKRRSLQTLPYTWKRRTEGGKKESTR